MTAAFPKQRTATQTTSGSDSEPNGGIAMDQP
jgi:hypothetical protein